MKLKATQEPSVPIDEAFRYCVTIGKKAIYDLANSPKPYGYKKPQDRPGYRIRKDSYRII